MAKMINVSRCMGNDFRFNKTKKLFISSTADGSEKGSKSKVRSRETEIPDNNSDCNREKLYQDTLRKSTYTNHHKEGINSIKWQLWFSVFRLPVLTKVPINNPQTRK